MFEPAVSEQGLKSPNFPLDEIKKNLLEINKDPKIQSWGLYLLL
jgi:hypothetical protein